MNAEVDGRDRRLVQVRAMGGIFKGYLLTSPVVSTLNDLNVAGNRFLTLHEPQVLAGNWKLSSEPLALAKSSILFLTEVDVVPSQPVYTAQTEFFRRSLVRLWLLDHHIQGFHHVPMGVTCMTRLRQGGHSFMALTSATVTGPGLSFSTPFVAINQSLVLAAQEMEDDTEADSPADLAESSATSLPQSPAETGEPPLTDPQIEDFVTPQN